MTKLEDLLYKYVSHEKHKAFSYVLELAIKEAYQAGRDSKQLDEEKVYKFLLTKGSSVEELLAKQLCQSTDLWRGDI